MNNNKKKSVLFLMHMPPPVHGAAMVGKYIKDSSLINQKFDCSFINIATARDLEDIGKGGIVKLLKFFKLLYIVLKNVINLNPDLVYVTPNASGGAFYKDFVLVEFLKLLRCKVLLHYHNKGVSDRQNIALDNFLYRIFFKNVKVILLAESLYDDLKKYVKKDDVYYCPNGIPQILKCEIQAERRNSFPHILFLSNLIVSKGVIILLDALCVLKNRGCKFICNFVGGETAEMNAENFNNYCKGKGLSDVIFFQGKKYGDEKDLYFRDADIFVFPSYYHNECFPLVSLEAMRYKLPVVTTNEGGIPDIVKDGETGFIVKCNHNNTPPVDVLELASVIEKLIDDKELRCRMGENGYKLYSEKFTLEVFERRMVEILDNV